MHSLPIFVRLTGRPVILLGEGHMADAKARLLARAGAVIVGEEAPAAIAVVAIVEPAEADAAVARLKARGILVNAVDRPDLSDFTFPAIVDRDPVLVAIGTGGASAGLAAALRQRLEAVLPAGLGRVARALHAARGAFRARFPALDDRRRAIADLLAPGGALDPLVEQADPEAAIASARPAEDRIIRLAVASADPDALDARRRPPARPGRSYLPCGRDSPRHPRSRARRRRPDRRRGARFTRTRSHARTGLDALGCTASRSN